MEKKSKESNTKEHMAVGSWLIVVVVQRRISVEAPDDAGTLTRMRISTPQLDMGGETLFQDRSRRLPPATELEENSGLYSII